MALIVGGGITGALLASMLPPALLATAQLWEKSTAAGRFATKTPRGAAAGAPPSDTGAQYATAFDAPSAAALEAAAAAGVLRRLAPGAILGEREPTASLPSYFAPLGARSLPEHYLGAAARGGLALHKGRRLVALEVGVPPQPLQPSGQPAPLQWRATDEAGGEAWFPAVVLTLPVPQVLELRGAALAEALAPLRPALAAVAYSSRYAYTLHFAAGALARFAARLPWHARYVGASQAGGDALRYLAFENRKQGEGLHGSGMEGALTTFTAHSTVELGALHDKATPELEQQLQRAVLAALRESMGEGEGAAPLPEVVEGRLHRWKFSQVLQGGGFSAPAQLLQHSGALPPLILAGDGMAGKSNFSACLASATEAARLLQLVQQQPR